MSEKTPRDHDTRGTDALRDLLRAADPAGAAAQEGLDPIERANLRQRITAAAGQDAPPGWYPPLPPPRW